MGGVNKYRDEEWLREQYIEQRRSTTTIAEICGCSASTVGRWLENHDIEKRPARRPAPDERLTDPEWLRQQYLDQRQTTTEIAGECGCAASTVGSWLERHDIEKRGNRARIADKRLTDPDWLREQYVEQERPSAEIAEECGCSGTVVRKWLNKHNIETRSGGRILPDRRLTDSNWLYKQYVEQEKSTTQIGEECGCDGTTVARWLRKHNIAVRDVGSHLPDERLNDREWLHEQYVEKRLSTRDIADVCGCGKKAVGRYLRRHGIGVDESRTAGLSGEDHPNYKGGYEPYGPGWTNTKKHTVRERDNYTCQDTRCSVTQADHLDEFGEKLHVHHLRKARDVDDPEERNAPANLITLCRDCHARWEKIADAGLVPQVNVSDATD